MYNPQHFAVADVAGIHDMMRHCRAANLVTSTQQGLMASFLPVILDEHEGEFGVLYAHLARANPQWSVPVIGDALAIFNGPQAYITPSWYASKAEHGKVVPTWNYSAVHAGGSVEFFDDQDRLMAVVERLTRLHEQSRASPWSIDDAPANYVKAQLRGIVGMRLVIRKLDGKQKMSQNRTEADRDGVRSGLVLSSDPIDNIVSTMIPF